MSAPGNLWRRVHGRVTGRPTNFSWVMGGELAGSGLPTSPGELEWARAQGVGSVVTMTEEPLPAAWVRGMGYLHVPTPDLAPPAPAGLDEAVRFALGSAAAGRPAMVHCAAGLGRAGTVLACCLVARRGLAARDAVEELRRMRPGSVQSPEQEAAVAEYEARARGGQP